MEFREVIRRRRMVRTYAENRPIPPEVIDRIARTALRAPSAGFSQGWGFLVLPSFEDVERFRQAATPEQEPENWFAAQVRAPLIIVTHSNKDAYLDRYAQPDKGFTDRSDDWWSAPYWDIDTGFAAMLILLAAVDEGLGACFFGLPKDRIDAYRQAFGVPAELWPIGAVSIGYPAEPPRDLRARRRPVEEVIRYGRWDTPPGSAATAQARTDEPTAQAAPDEPAAQAAPDEPAAQAAPHDAASHAAQAATNPSASSTATYGTPAASATGA